MHTTHPLSQPPLLLRACVALCIAALVAACGDDNANPTPSNTSTVGPDAGASDTDTVDANADDTGDDVALDTDDSTARRVALSVPGDAPIAEVDPRYVSVAVDTAQVVGGTFWNPDGSQGTTGNARVPEYDFDDPKLRNLARHLAPAYLRIGGSDADLTYYDLSDDPVEEAPTGDAWVMTRAQWDRLNRFAVELDYEVLFTLNAGPDARDDADAWRDTNARALIEYTVARDYPVVMWELGNEINAFAAIHGLDAQVTPARYAADIALARVMVDALDPDSALAGPSSAYWPIAGEPNPLLPGFIAAGGGAALDVLTWHYYPQQSSRCPLALREATEDLMLDPANLDEVLTWAADVERHHAEGAPQAEIWLGESGHAQCGGAPGISDRFASGFWWLDQLGALAQRGHRVVVRQTLSGSDYGILSDTDLSPRPDYWNSVLFKRLMGERVLRPNRDDQASPDAAPSDTHLRAYAHCSAARADNPSASSGGVAFVLLNLHASDPIEVSFDAALGGTQHRYVLDADSLTSATVRLNGAPLEANADGTLPTLTPDTSASPSAPLVLPPRSYAFVVLPDAQHPACPAR